MLRLSGAGRHGCPQSIPQTANAGPFRSATMLAVAKSKSSVALRRLAVDIMNKDSGVFEELLALVRHYTIAFVSIPDAPNDHPWPSGAATLVTIGGSHYFLTAEHVWRALKKFRSVGITLVPEIDQCFTIPTSHLMAVGPPRPAAENEGPDIVLLKIPEAKLGEIKARKSFYPLEPVAQKLRASAKCIEIAILLGAPGESAKLMTRRNLDMTIHGIMADHKAKKFTKGRYDYIDSKGFFGAHGFPKSHGGFSGGGLWHVHLYLDPKTGERQERYRLWGVAFYEFPAKRKYRIIRCHGARSIDAVKALLRVQTTKPSKRIMLT